MDLPDIDPIDLLEAVSSLAAMTSGALAVVSKPLPDGKADVARLLLDARPTFLDGSIIALIDRHLDILTPRRRDGDARESGTGGRNLVLARRYVDGRPS